MKKTPRRRVLTAAIAPGKEEGRPSQSIAAGPQQRRPVFDPLARGTGRGPRPTGGRSGRTDGAIPPTGHAAHGSVEANDVAAPADNGTGRVLGTGEGRSRDQQARKENAPGGGVGFDPLRKRSGASRAPHGSGVASMRVEWPCVGV